MWKRCILSEWYCLWFDLRNGCRQTWEKDGRKREMEIKPFPSLPNPSSFLLSNGGYFNHLDRLSYDLEMKTRKRNRNNKRTEIERFDWFIQLIQKHVAFGWESVKGETDGGRRKIINKLVIVVTKSAPDLLKPEWRLLVVVHVFAMNLWNAVFVLEFLSVILLFSFVFSQLLHFVSWVNENPHTCHA